MESLRGDILRSDLLLSPSSDVNTLLIQYESVLGGLLEKHAPLLTHTIRCRPNSPWYNDELRQAKKELRRLERTTFSRSGGCLEIHRQIFEKKRQQYKRAIASSKIKYHRDQLSNCNARELFRKVDNLSRPQSLKQLPDNSGSSLSLPERFQQFVVNKVKTITDSLQSESDDTNFPDFPEQRQLTCSFTNFRPVTDLEVTRIIRKSPSTTCGLDAFPTAVLKQCLEELVPTLTFLINESFQSGYFPEGLKHSNISPLIKDSKLDKDDLKNYRPIANLKFVAKTVERAAVSQIQKYVSEYHLQAKTQSAYRPSHSCETALLRVSSDILMSLDKGQEVILILLDYSSAFDTISHDTILQRLPQWFGIRGRALDWFRTYFTSRTQSVVIDGIQSSAHTPTCGVPQGSVIGPLIFTMYTAPLEKIIEAHGFSKMFYADDTQIYISLLLHQRFQHCFLG